MEDGKGGGEWIRRVGRGMGGWMDRQDGWLRQRDSASAPQRSSPLCATEVTWMASFRPQRSLPCLPTGMREHPGDGSKHPFGPSHDSPQRCADSSL